MAIKLFSHLAADPCFNMAFDEAMLHHVQSRPGCRLVRLYTWRPGAITIGVHQDASRAVDRAYLEGTPVIRRITGGRALYHDEAELTYAIAMNLHGTAWAPLAGSIAPVYHRLADILADFLHSLGRTASVERGTQRPESQSGRGTQTPCFASTARYELVAAGRKIVASAQRQIGACVLQHGAIKLGGVAAHPALPGIASDASPGPALDHKQFDEIVLRFARALERGWPDTEVLEADTEDIPELQSHLERVRRAPEDRRDSFEQSSLTKGL
jgi:lipoate-protein ligase A